MTNDKRHILVVEDAAGVAAMYKELLSDEYEVTVCHSGEQAQAVIEQGTHFDLAIMDIVLPPEDMVNMSLEDCRRTGVRLMAAMIRRGICSRFYVLTVLKDLKPEVDEVCNDARVAAFKFQYKLNLEPDELKDDIKQLLEQQVQ